MGVNTPLESVGCLLSRRHRRGERERISKRSIALHECLPAARFEKQGLAPLTESFWNRAMEFVICIRDLSGSVATI